MPSFKDEQRNTWYCKFYYVDHTGARKQKKKRGFTRKKDADQWERDFLNSVAGSPEMTFESLCKLYLDDKKAHTKITTYETKKNRIDNWLLPFFADRPINEITPVEIRKWQGDIKEKTTQAGKPLSKGYLQNIFIELSGIFNFAIRFYGLPSNPCHVAGNMIGKKNKSVNFWTKEEFDKFISTFDHADPYYTMFMILYYTGMRKGELQALTPADIDLSGGSVSVSKTFKLVDSKEYVLPPKTPKSNRTILIPPFLCDVIRDFENRIYDLKDDYMLFNYGRSTFKRHLENHAAIAGVKPIRIHDLRHSHASLLIELGFSALLVAERLGHENVSTTLDTYSHLFPSKQSQVTDKLQKLFEKE